MFWKKRKGGAEKKTIIFFASDLHGSDICFKKFVNAAKFYGATALIMGASDMSCQKMILAVACLIWKN